MYPEIQLSEDQKREFLREQRGCIIGRRLADDGHVHFTDERHRVRWGQYSIVEASLAGLRHLRTLGRFDRVLLMSGQDYPVRPLAEIRAFCRSS